MSTKQLMGTQVVLILLFIATSVPLAHAGSSQQSFIVPATITVKMYQLNNDGSRTSFLCTEEVAITMSSRGNKPLPTVKAQAIAARTYVYFRHGLTINNSTQYQVFVPYYFDTLTSAQQQRVDEAVSDVWYMTLPNSTDPIDALYGADNGATTLQGSTSYLKSVPDPISAAYGSPNGTLNGGMSSRGASRWGFGHTSSRGPDYETSPNYPHDSNGDGDFWSVRYDWARQILTHYYTGIHIRDASGTILTPAYRWVPLSVTWSEDCPPSMEGKRRGNGLPWLW